MTDALIHARELAERAASRLSPVQRHVLFLSAVQGRSPEEIGRVLGTDEERAIELLALALAAFDRALAECTGEPPPSRRDSPADGA